MVIVIKKADFETQPFSNLKTMKKATGLTPSKIVRKKYPKAWSSMHPIVNSKIFIIRNGEYNSELPYPSWGEKIGECQTLKQAWQNAAKACC
jgi:hypothetical protein